MRGQFVNGDSHTHSSPDEIVIASVFDTLDSVGDLSVSERAGILLTVTTVILRELAHLDGPVATSAIRTIKDLSTEYVNRKS